MKNTIEQEIFKVLDVNVKETRLIVEFISIVTGETEQDVVNTLMNLVQEKRITLVEGGKDAYVYCSLYKDLNEETLAEIAEEHDKENIRLGEALANLTF